MNLATCASQIYNRNSTVQTHPNPPNMSSMIPPQNGQSSVNSHTPFYPAEQNFTPTNRTYPNVLNMEGNHHYQATTLIDTKQHRPVNSDPADDAPHLNGKGIWEPARQTRTQRLPHMNEPKPLMNHNDQKPSMNMQHSVSYNYSHRPPHGEQTYSPNRPNRGRRRSYIDNQTASQQTSQVRGQPLYFNQSTIPAEQHVSSQPFLWQAKPHRHKR